MIIIIIIWTVIFDALRDGLEQLSWTKRHVIKWLGFYPIIIYAMIISKMAWWLWILLPLLSWGIWQLVIRYICHKDWVSVWVKLIKLLKGK